MGVIGYARVSTVESRQHLHRQLDAHHVAGCERVFEDRAPAADPGTGRSSPPASTTCVIGIGFKALNGPMDTTTPAGRATRAPRRSSDRGASRTHDQRLGLVPDPHAPVQHRPVEDATGSPQSASSPSPANTSLRRA